MIMTGSQRNACEWPDWWATFIPKLGETTAQHIREEAKSMIEQLGQPPEGSGVGFYTEGQRLF
jgi:hypothetical protein